MSKCASFKYSNVKY